MDALISHRISGQEFQIVLFIIRKTYGFNKKCDFISMGQIAKATGINRPQVCKLLSSLYRKNILGVIQKDNTVIQKDNTPPNCLYFQKDWEKWQVLYKKITRCTKTQHPVIQNDNKGVVQNDTHKRKKETLTKENIILYPEWLPLEEFFAYKEKRKEIKKPLTGIAEKLAIQKLEALRNDGNDPKLVLEQSIFSSWQGLFPLKEQNKPQRKKYL